MNQQQQGFAPPPWRGLGGGQTYSTKINCTSFKVKCTTCLNPDCTLGRWDFWVGVLLLCHNHLQPEAPFRATRTSDRKKQKGEKEKVAVNWLLY